MKIKTFKLYAVSNPPPAFGGNYWIFIQLTTDNGISGIGEIYSVPFRPETVMQMAADLCERRVVGANPFHIEELWRRVYSDGYTQRPDISVMGILSAVEMACWDIIGKELNKPVYELLGGQVRDSLRSYTYLYPQHDNDPVYTDPHAAAEAAARCAAQGFTAVKFDPSGPYTAYDPRQLDLPALTLSEKFVRCIREAVGDQCDLLFGTHGQMTPAGAIRLAQRIAPYDPLWFEEPTPPDNPAGMATVAAATTIPIAAGERLCTKYEFAALLTHKAAAILQMNLGRVGGILEAKKIAGMAEAHHAQIAPHLYCGPVIGAANIQLATCTPNFLILESIQQWGGFHADILKTPIQWEQGYVIPPTAAGLGVELNETLAAEHAYTGGALHLNPLDNEIKI
ncbi:MAG: mandelate racemase/muconate lactonizing enzyme family protein [Proteobacteria bacterium]|nr:mandelate racemase/muconate lactonizing enzyme family protein [Pseudomonadota bacterium]MCH9758149.1 mandelate racemase/muconate lactonizing enzyme family protein [Pseudomonadota bacterium]